MIHRHEPIHLIVKRIIYSSQAVVDFSPEELIKLLEVSRHNNERANVSGMLLYCCQSFLQMLEGDPAALEQTYRRILADERHANLRLLMNAQVSDRIFPDWTMGFEHVDDEDLAQELDGYTPETDHPLVNPDLITNGRVAQTLLELYGRNRVR